MNSLKPKETLRLENKAEKPIILPKPINNETVSPNKSMFIS
jgi:hypothetical protein